MSDELQSGWNWGPAVRRRLARIETALHSSIGPDARFESGAGRQGGGDEAFLDGDDAFGEPSEDDVLGYGGASRGEDEAWRNEASNSADAARAEERERRLKPTKRGLETLQAVVAELTQLAAATRAEEDSSSARKNEGGMDEGTDSAEPETSPIDVPERPFLEADAAADEPSEHRDEAPGQFHEHTGKRSLQIIHCIFVFFRISNSFFAHNPAKLMHAFFGFLKTH